jgi:hypothetical protein
MKSLTVSSLVATALLSSIGAVGAATIDYPANGNTVHYWGPSSLDNQSYGEIFTAPQAVLDDYSLSVYGTQSFPFVSQVYQWTGSTTVGSALYTSVTSNTTTTLTTFTFSPDMVLIPGDQYIAFVTNQPSGVSLGGSGFGYMETSSVNRNNFRFAEFDPQGGTWFPDVTDAAFTANFSDVSSTPLPATLPLFAGGLGLVGMFARRRKRNGAAVLAAG